MSYVMYCFTFLFLVSHVETEIGLLLKLVDKNNDLTEELNSPLTDQFREKANAFCSAVSMKICIICVDIQIYMIELSMKHPVNKVKITNNSTSKDKSRAFNNEYFTR